MEDAYERPKAVQLTWGGEGPRTEDVVEVEQTVVRNSVARVVRLPIVDRTTGQCEDVEPNVVQNGNGRGIAAPIGRRNVRHIGNGNVEIACSSRVHCADRGGESALYTFQDADCSNDASVARAINLSESRDVIEGRDGGRTESGSQHEWREEGRGGPDYKGLRVRPNEVSTPQPPRLPLYAVLDEANRRGEGNRRRRGGRSVRGTVRTSRPAGMMEIQDLTGHDASTVWNDLDNGEILPVTKEVNSVEHDVRRRPGHPVKHGRGRPRKTSGTRRGGSIAAGNGVMKSGRRYSERCI